MLSRVIIVERNVARDDDKNSFYINKINLQQDSNMKARNVIFSLVLMLAVVGFAIIKFRIWEPQRKEIFNRNPSHIEYTRHAECRMNCRHISKEDISDVMRRGVIIFNKSILRDKPCPTFALQGFTDNGENIRIIFAQCPGVTKVVTCYNLKKDFNCDCGIDKERAITFFNEY